MTAPTAPDHDAVQTLAARSRDPGEVVALAAPDWPLAAFAVMAHCRTAGMRPADAAVTAIEALRGIAGAEEVVLALHDALLRARSGMPAPSDGLAAAIDAVIMAHE